MAVVNKQTLYRVAVSVLFLFFVRLAASAQSHEYLMTIQVPFDFQVNEKQLPAGKYVIRRDPQMPQVLLIQGPGRNIWVAVQTIPHSLSEQSTRTRLIFKEYGSNRFLSEVNAPVRGERYVLIKSRAERRLAQVDKEKAIHATSKSSTTNN